MNILCWNAKGLGAPKKCSILHDIIKDHNIDIIIIQEIKKKYLLKECY
jgi:exonuclease III